MINRAGKVFLPVTWVVLDAVVVPYAVRKVKPIIDVVLLLHCGCIYDPQRR